MDPLFLNAPFTVSNFTFDLYRWAVACVTTRINFIPSQYAKDSNGEPVAVRGIYSSIIFLFFSI
uniref:Bestrophin homolog n=1 Tax=Parascaris equorum TaxID=6256 RepID=A0A914SF55_PAREQ